MSKIERVVPEGGRLGSTPGGGGSPAETSILGSFEKFVFGAAVSAVDCRNGGFCAFDEDVPPGVKFQNIPSPPRTMVRPVPPTS